MSTHGKQNKFNRMKQFLSIKLFKHKIIRMQRRLVYKYKAY